MKNIETYTGSDISLVVPVPDGTLSGDIVPLPNGLIAVCITPQATQTLHDLGACIGVPIGQASSYLRGKTIVANLLLATSAAQFDRIYKAADGTYTTVATSNTLIGHAYEAIAAPGVTTVIIL